MMKTFKVKNKKKKYLKCKNCGNKGSAFYQTTILCPICYKKLKNGNKLF